MEASSKPNRSIKFIDLEITALISEEESRDKVYKVVDRFTGVTYALKEINNLDDSADRTEISREIEILKTLDHPNLVKCHEVFHIGDRICLLLEYMDRGSLDDNNITTEYVLASVAYQVILGLRYLHRNKISHGDIKPSNIFTNSMKQVKVLYLGKKLSKNPMSLTVIGAIHDGFSWDVWSVGLCVLKLFKGLTYGNIEFSEGDEFYSLGTDEPDIHSIDEQAHPIVPAVKQHSTEAANSKKEAAAIETKGGKRKRGIHLTLEDLRPHCGKRLEDAAKHLDVVRSTIERVCRDDGIPRWPVNKKDKKNALKEEENSSKKEEEEGGGEEEEEEKKKNTSIELWRFLLCCMQIGTDVSKRWTSEELIGHPFFEHLSASSFRTKKETSVLHASASAASDVTVSYEEKEQISPRTKKLKSSIIASASAASDGTVSDEEKEQISPRTEYLKSPIHASASAASDGTMSYDEKEQISPRTKKLKSSIEDDKGIYEVESSGNPTKTVSYGHFGRCIEHCTLFLLDCEFEKDKLVQLWIAEECIALEGTNRMEDVANLYFDALVCEQIIVPSKFDHRDRRMKYKVDTSKTSTWFLRRGNYIRIDEGNLDEIHGEVLHIMWNCKRLDRILFDVLNNTKQLRTLVVLEAGSALIKQLPDDIFLGLKLLRTLDLSRTHISELPGSIRLLESLKYLDISGTPIKQLPESTDHLYSLQTLKLKGCFGLFALPRGLGRLINLRHLDLHIVGQLKSMPRGMGNLIELQTLQGFIVGKNDGCGIAELKNMNKITGSFCISGLENVSTADEAKEAALAVKQYIDKLQLRWNVHGNDSTKDTLEILECLQPHFHLRELEIICYSGSKLPSWISNPAFSDLSSITLYKCINCDILPSIGELPYLKILHIVEMKNVRDINTLFCRNFGSQGNNAFPRLEKLTLDNMLNLEEWTGIEDGDFPCLRHISIRYCPKLSVLPSLSHLSALQHLEINDCIQLFSLPDGALPGSLECLIIRSCPKINERCLKDGGEDWFKIASVKNIWIDFEKISLD